jgi:Double zinc ribbon
MTESKKPGKSTVAPGSDQGLLCAKCGESNARHSNTCFACGAHLHIVCHHCGHRNPRIAQHCGECGRRLHRSLWQKLEKRVFKRGTKLTSFQIALLIVAVYITYKIIVKFAEMPATPPPG